MIGQNVYVCVIRNEINLRTEISIQRISKSSLMLFFLLPQSRSFLR